MNFLDLHLLDFLLLRFLFTLFYDTFTLIFLIFIQFEKRWMVNEFSFFPVFSLKIFITKFRNRWKTYWKWESSVWCSVCGLKVLLQILGNFLWRWENDVWMTRDWVLCQLNSFVTWSWHEMISWKILSLVGENWFLDQLEYLGISIIKKRKLTCDKRLSIIHEQPPNFEKATVSTRIKFGEYYSNLSARFEIKR